MSYIYSRVLVEAFLLGNCSDTDASVLLSEMLMLKPSCWHDRTMEPSLLSQFGMTSLPLTDDLGVALLMSSLEDSRARILARQDEVQESPEPDQDCGQKWQESSVKYDLDSCSWKTAPYWLSEDLPWSSVTLPKWGMTRNGAVFQHPTLVRPINATGSGSWPTPQASDNRDRGNMSTPSVARRIEKGKQISLSMSVSHENGRLNPNWVEWLMGWPIGHTDLKRSEMDKFQEWQQQHSKY